MVNISPQNYLQEKKDPFLDLPNALSTNKIKINNNDSNTLITNKIKIYTTTTNTLITNKIKRNMLTLSDYS